jgi:hypothetical protein
VARFSFSQAWRVRCFGPACVAVFRALARSLQFARVGASRLFILRGARGWSQRGVCRQRFVLRSQATSFAALPVNQSSGIVRAQDGVGVCRLTRHSSGRLRRRLIPALELT